MTDGGEVPWFPVLTLFLGFCSSALLEAWRDKRATSEKNREKLEERQYQQKIRRAELQFENLISAQDSVGRFLRANGEAQHHDTLQNLRSGKWKLTTLDAGLNQRLFDENALLSNLSSRIRNEEIRTLIGELRSLSAKAMLAMSQAESRSTLSTMVNITQRLDELIGKEIREFPDSV